MSQDFHLVQLDEALSKINFDVIGLCEVKRDKEEILQRHGYILSQRLSRPRKADYTEGLRVIKYLVSTKDLQLTLGNENSKGTTLAYSDANWAENREDRRPTSGVLCKVFGSTVSWSSRRQSVVSLSTDFGIKSSGPSVVKIDSQSSAKMVTNEKFSNRTKHIDVRFMFVKECVDSNKILLEYCPSELNTADMLTKPLAGIKIKALRELANLR